VTRWLAGALDPSSRVGAERVRGALRPRGANFLASGPLLVSYTGAANPERAPLCLLDGYLDNCDELADALGAGADAHAEQLLALGWRRWGLDLLGRLRGEFALLIWDQERSEGVLARDQMGVRSLFLHERDGDLRFASETRDLLALLPQRPAPDPLSVAHWITMSNRQGAATLYQGVRRLGPGCALVIESGRAREVRYWAPRFAEPLSERGGALAAHVRSQLELAVSRRIAPEGLTGVLMSGGLDSSSVAAVAAEQAPGRVWAQAAVFPDHPAVDESQLIGQLRAHLGLPGVTATVRAGGMLASALDSIEEWQLPLRSWGDFWGLPLLRAAAADGVAVTIGGDGGDELFGVRAFLASDRLRAGHPRQALGLIREMPGAGDRPSRREVARIYANTAVAGAIPYGLHRLATRLSRRSDAPAWLLGATAGRLAEDEHRHDWKRMAGPRWWAETAHGLTSGIEAAGMFEHQRRRAATAGMQARHALFDLDLVELCLRMAPEETFDRHRSRPVLRAAMSGLLPDPVRMRPQKALFDSLLIECLTGPDHALAVEVLCDPAAELGAYVDLPAMRSALLGEGAQRSFRWMWQLWRLLSAECWLRHQADPGHTAALRARAGEPRVELDRSAPATPAAASR